MSGKYFAWNLPITCRDRFQWKSAIEILTYVRHWIEKVKGNPTTNLWNVVPPILQAATPVLAVTYTFECFNDFNISFNKKDLPTPAEPVIKTFLNRKISSMQNLKMTILLHRTAFMMIILKL